jgi:ATP-binding cassette subfamily G (WHITE) protein 1
MITNPSIIFLDEPTSGLDTYSAYNLIKNLKDLTNMGRTVISTIHQPSSDILRLFDDMIILNHGKIIYLGEVNNLVDYFSSIGYQCPEYTNPSDFIFMNILNPISVENKLNNNINDINISTIEEKDKYILESYSKSGLEKSVMDKCNMINSNKINLSERSHKYKSNMCIQYKFLLQRHMKSYFEIKQS